MVQELDTLGQHGVSHADHVLGQVLHEGEEATLRVEPGVRTYHHMCAVKFVLFDSWMIERVKNER